jgi:D-alanyl-lipoteichoic acid acyltransferase DltB (MBOAT superfamily)
LKVFVADNLAFIVDEVFAMESFTQASTIIGSYAFAFQIYGDFAGYTFIAIGVARLMGFRLMTNFLYPYFVTNPSDFWKNWHISLSSWLKDYLYIPLGGNRMGKYLTLRNLMITMILGGLWHGAAWNFVLWGLFHGLILILFKLYSDKNKKESYLKRGVGFWIKVFLFFQVTCLAWLLFRVESIPQLGEMLNSLLEFKALSQLEINFIRQVIFYTFIPIVVMFFQFKYDSGNYIDSFHPIARVVLYIIMFYAIFSFGEFGAKEFIYFQF